MRDDPAIGAGLEIESVNARERHADQRDRRELVAAALGQVHAAAALDQQQVMQLAMCVRPNCPIVQAAALGDRLDVQEALVDVLAGLAVQEILGNTASRH
jgi:hypothetical protein